MTSQGVETLPRTKFEVACQQLGLHRVTANLARVGAVHPVRRAL